ncbi:MAG: hypothetical protein AB1665_02495 [Candidatus Thermoplasmatota archaeon]
MAVKTKPMGSWCARLLTQCCAVLIFLGLTAPIVAGDGVPIYPPQPGITPTLPPYAYTWETRQLARIELLNDTAERISLFLSIFSLDPGRKLTVAVPLYTLPGAMDGSPTSEEEFRKDVSVEAILSLGTRQSWKGAWDAVRRSLGTGFTYVSGAMLVTAPGVILGDYVSKHGWTVRGWKGDGRMYPMGGYMTAGYEDRQVPVQQYVFDGMSVDVYSIESGMNFTELLSYLHVTFPEEEQQYIAQRYSGAYVAVINTVTRPPIPEMEYERLQSYAPKTLDRFKSYVLEHKVMNGEEVVRLAMDYQQDAQDEARRIDHYYTLSGAMYDLVLATYGAVAFEGYRLDITLPLDDGKIYFPLGTSPAWSNPIDETAVLFSVPQDREVRFSIPYTAEAYSAGKHYYLFHYTDTNPSEDAVGMIVPGSQSAVQEALTAQAIADNAHIIAVLLISLVFAAIAAGWLVALRARHTKRAATVLLAFICFSALVSIWLAVPLVLTLSKGRMSKACSWTLCTTVLVFGAAALVLI